MGNHASKRLEASHHNGDLQTIMVIKSNKNGEMQVAWGNNNPFHAFEILAKAQVAVMNYGITTAVENSKKQSESRIIVP